MEDLDVWKNNRTELVKEFNKVSDKLEKHNKNCRIAKLTGASASIVGTGMVIGGLIAAPFTFGASLGLAISGGILEVSGGLTGAGATMTNNLLRRANMKELQKLIDQDREHTEKIQKQYDTIKNMAVKEDKSSPSCPLDCVINGLKVSATVGRAVGKGVDVLADTASVFKTLVRASKVVLIGGIAVGVVCDIYTLVTESIDEHKKSIPAVVKDLRKVAEEMKEQMQEVELLY